MMSEVVASVPMNIALVKYWGKRDEQLILPLNDSISLTVDVLRAETTVRMIHGAGEHKVEINGERVELSSNKRYETVFNEALRLLRKRKDAVENPHISYHFEIISTTNFPVAAGLASSAAGFAAIASGLQRLLNLDDVQANRLARIGSGSACRSMFGGLVHWKKGEKADGSDCVAERVATATWDELFCLILVFNDRRKIVGSSEGMRRTRDTSTLLAHRISTVVPARIEQIKRAYAERDFETLGRTIMADSNQFHAVCLDSSPPIHYLNRASWQLIELVEKFNRDGIRAAYTFDAGPNACVILRRKDIADFMGVLLDHHFQPPPEDVTAIQAVLTDRIQCPITPQLAETYIKCSRLFLSPMGGAPETK